MLKKMMTQKRLSATGHGDASFKYLVRLVLPMIEIDVTRMSSKGQIVIPAELREGFKEGEKLVIIKSGDQLILKHANEVDRQFAEDIRFARRTEAALKRYEKGLFKETGGEEFLKALEKW